MHAGYLMALAACETLVQAWDDGEEAQDIEWESLTVAVDMAKDAIEQVRRDSAQ